MYIEQTLSNLAERLAAIELQLERIERGLEQAGKPDPCLTAKDAAALIGCCEQHIPVLVARGYLAPTMHEGKSRPMYRTSAINACREALAGQK